jgi:precorrin-8X/cobalt-precorrin-8 methylmutase
MEWHLTDAQSLAIIDQELRNGPDGPLISPAELEILKRVIYSTADFEYRSSIRFSPQALAAGAAAIAARSTIIVDVPMVQVGIMPTLQATFSNPVYCSLEAITRPQRDKSQAAWGMETLARRYAEGIFVVGQSQTALRCLVELIESRMIRPALVIATPAQFIDIEPLQHSLAKSAVPHIRTDGRKGNAAVAAAILNGLVDLTWLAYGTA